MSTKEQAQLAKQASAGVAHLSEEIKKDVLYHIADYLISNEKRILAENQKDLEEYRGQESLKDRLLLNHQRIEAMATGLRQVADLSSLLHQVKQHRFLENGLELVEKYVPLGNVGLIYEARPNVTVDGFALCFKTGNSVVLRGGHQAYHSNKILVTLIQEVLAEYRINHHVIELIEDQSRQSVADMLQLRGILDVIVPRGGAALIDRVVKESWVPVIETGAGNCHLYVDEEVDQAQALAIIENAKCSRVSVCNALESLVIHQKQIETFMPKLIEKIASKVELRGEALLTDRYPVIKRAEPSDWGQEYLDNILSIKVVSNLEEAIAHINKYHSMHSDGILTLNQQHADIFCNEIDSAVVYVNASTRFSDGFEFGLGAELGISTQKLHARGPMGLQALLTTKTYIKGNGQVR